MIAAAKEFFSVLRDRDFLSIGAFLIFFLSLFGAVFGVCSIRDAGLFMMTFILSRLLFIYRTELLVDSMSEKLLDRINAERSKPGFENGNLSHILSAEFPRIAAIIKQKCLKELEKEMELILSPAGDYTFQSPKAYRQAAKAPRR